MLQNGSVSSQNWSSSGISGIQSDRDCRGIEECNHRILIFSINIIMIWRILFHHFKKIVIVVVNLQE